MRSVLIAFASVLVHLPLGASDAFEREGPPRGLANALPRPSGEREARFRKQVEADWLLREAYRAIVPGREGVPLRDASVTAAVDAAGGCDGVKDGTYGFHTGLARDPWWQVDLGETRSLSKVVVWNRLDGASDRASRLALLLSDDGAAWHAVYQHDGSPFGGVPDRRPLEIDLGERSGRFVRIQVPGTTYLHLDEVEVFGAAGGAADRAEDAPERNLALGRPADQASTSQWSRSHARPPGGRIDWAARVAEILDRSERLAAELDAEREPCGIDTSAIRTEIGLLRAGIGGGEPEDLEAETRHAAEIGLDRYLAARWIQRRLTLATPLLHFDAILVTKRVPASFNHMSDQYIGWWSRPGGGIYILRGFREGAPSVRRITEPFTEPGSFLRPDLSHDGKRVLFAWCRHYPDLAAHPNKLDKDNVPEDAFYHVFEMDLEGTDVRRLTSGKYDDFDARYLPDGRIVFLSTRRGQSVQCGRESAARTLLEPDLPDIYVRCGGGPERPCVVYTLHTMDARGGDMHAISPFEMFEWTPSVGQDGTILYSRWDYVDRDNMPYMGLWSIRPDGTNARSVYGNFTKAPHCAFEPRPIPGSRKIVFTASAHHQQTKGSLVLLDPAVGDEGDAPITRLTPEVPFPEIEGWPLTYYAGPWPLSERFHLVSWSCEGASAPGPGGWDRWHAVPRPPNGMGLYLLDAEGNMELLYRDPEISTGDPIPIRPRERPPILARASDPSGPAEGRFLLADVYRGLSRTPRGSIEALRIVAVPPKTHPTMDFPNLGITRDDPGKCVLGTVPVEADGSAYFRVPAGVIVFFQALDERGVAVQTMRSATHVQPGQTLGCIGCHEGRQEAPPRAAPPHGAPPHGASPHGASPHGASPHGASPHGASPHGAPPHGAPPHGAVPLAARREPSRIVPGPEGSWPLRFDRLVQPVLDARCTGCHRPEGETSVAGARGVAGARAVAVGLAVPEAEAKAEAVAVAVANVEANAVAVAKADGERREAAKLDLTAGAAYESLVGWGAPSLRDLVLDGYRRGYSTEGAGTASRSALLAKIAGPEPHHDLRLDPVELERLIVWMDTYAQRLGSFSPAQERDLEALRERSADLLGTRPGERTAGTLPAGSLGPGP